jgi:dihydroorotate dehydrogenase electron transfer subunit
MVRSATDQLDPLLPRPLAVHDVDEDVVRVLIEPKGKGTRVLADVAVGQRLHVLGPLGHGFETRKSGPALIAGGGIGVAPLKLLATALSQEKRKVHLLLGFRSRREAAAAQLFRQFEPEVWTDDGSLGNKGLASQALSGYLDDADKSTELFACGPPPMLSAIASIAAERHSSLQVALDSHMACGIGSCQGCVTQSKQGFVKVCTDGPVFNAQDLEW